ncbi:MAG: hypothetical protein ACFE0J_26245 [Elainellaceae cyanobacterium]
MANPYERCTDSLIGAGVSESDAASACAASLEPRDLAGCVARISDGTPISSTEALAGCRRVRRPIDMASCVVDIEGDVEGAEPLDVLERCRRSLLPDQYSDCVVGLNAETALSATDVLQTCVAADYNRPVEFPADFLPRPVIDPSDL